MIRPFIHTSGCSILVLSLMALAAPAAAQTVVAFVDVNVVPMDSERILTRQTVVVSDRRIAAIGARDSVTPPVGAQIIDGHGRLWLSPGLADMHVHGTEEEDLGSYVALGVTTVLHMGDAPPFFLSHVRPAIASGQTIGPQMFFAMKVDGAPTYGLFFVGDAEQARAMVRVAKKNGYDYFKVYSQLTAAQFDAIADEAHKVGLPVIGHGVTTVGLPAALAKGQVMVAHGEEFLYTAFQDENNPNGVPSMDAIPPVVGAVRRSGAFITPNLVAYETIARQWGRPEQVDSFLAAPEAAYLTPTVRLSWSQPRYGERTGTLEPRLMFLRRFTKALADSGVPLLAGTDAPTIAGLVPGYSLHQELRNLTQSGLTPFQALSAATRTAGDFVGRTHRDVPLFGQVAVGMRGDLVLSQTNPLESLETLMSPVGVMAFGRWFDAATLGSMLEERKRRYQRLDRLRGSPDR